ncbi:MAG: LysR substrate-binding domain-containing protein [Casimicrobiaceae bacterium]
MELRHLRYFVAIADVGTMARAAERVFVTQSTLSHQLAQLEQEVGCALFERIGRGLRLSDAGRELLGHARGVLAQVEEGKRAVVNARTMATGSLRVGVIHSFVTSFIPQVAANFVKAYPGVRLQVAELTAIEIEAQVVDGALDLGVAFFPATSDAVMGEHLFDDVLRLAVPASHPLAQRATVRFTELADLPLAMLGLRYATRRMLDTHFRRAGVQPKILLEIDSVDALHRVVEQGVAAAFLPGRSARRSARVHLIDVTHPKPVRPAGLVWRRSTYRSAAATAFVEKLKAELACAAD